MGLAAPLIVPLSYFIEKPFQNWTREGSALIGTAMIHVDYRAPVGIVRNQARRDRQELRHWDQRAGQLKSPTSRNK